MSINHPRRFYVERDNSTGRWDVFDAYTREYVVINVCRARADSMCAHMRAHQGEGS